MSTPTVAPANGTVHPGDFSDVPGAAPATTTVAVGAAREDGLAEPDKAALARVRDVIAQVRGSLAGGESQEVVAARYRLAQAIGYVVGYLDARGIRAVVGANPGIDALFPSTTTLSSEEALDKLLALLDHLTKPATRSVWSAIGEFFDSAGDVADGIGGMFHALADIFQ